MPAHLNERFNVTRSEKDIHGVDWEAVPQFAGVSRVESNPKTLMLCFNFEPSDDQLREIEALMLTHSWT